jgi:2-methylcitrate dehydratase PrpD
MIGKGEFTQALSSFIVKTDYGMLPRPSIEFAKKNILDCIGVSLAGTKTRINEIVRDFVIENGGSQVSGIIGGHMKSSPCMAAFANGTIAHALDYDDTNRSMSAHPSVSILPAVLAIGEQRKVSGEKIIEAYIIGYEIEAKLGLCMNPEHYELGWHSTATLGTFGALAAACKLLGLDEGQVLMAFGIASSLMGGLRRNFGTMTKPLHAGNAAKNGIIAASLAQKGFTSNDQIFEGSKGLFDIFSNKTDADLANVIAALGNPFDIIHPGTNIKLYPCCAFGHAAIDAMFNLIKRHHLSDENIDKVECGVHYRTREVMCYTQPKTSLEGKFSLEYCLAIAIIDNKIGLGQFENKKMNDDRVKETLKRIRIFVHPELKTLESFKNRFAEVTVHTKKGEIFTERVHTPMGTPQNPLSDSELRQKFKDCTRSILGENEIHRVVQLIDHLENLKQINELINIIVFETH